MAGTVTVACKIPNGLVLRVFVPETYMVPVMAGGLKEVTRSRPTEWAQKINGPARKIGQDVPWQIIHGAGLTHGVDAELFQMWLDQNKGSDYVIKGLVFAQAKPNDTIAQAQEHRHEKSGLEAIDPKNLPAEFKGKVETVATTAAAPAMPA
jgi:hypothetical protein